MRTLNTSALIDPKQKILLGVIVLGIIVNSLIFELQLLPIFICVFLFSIYSLYKFSNSLIFFSLSIAFYASFILFAAGMNGSIFVQILNTISLLSLLVIVLHYFSAKNQYDHYRLNFSDILIILLVFGIFIIVFVFKEINVGTKFFYTTKILIVSLCFFLIIPMYLIQKKRTIDFIKLLLFFGLLFSMIGLWMIVSNNQRLYIGSYFLGIGSSLFGGKGTTFSSLFFHPNATGAFYVILIPLCLGYMLFYLKEKPIKKKLYLISLLILFSTCALLTYSRASYLGIGVGVCFVLYFYSRKTLFTILLLSLPILIFLFSDFFSKKGIGSGVSRSILLFLTYRIIQSDPGILLRGIKSDPAEAIILQKKTFYITDLAESPHNVYVNYVLNFGLPIALIFITFVLKTIISSTSWINKSRTHPNYKEVVLFSSVVVGILTQQFFEDILNDFNNYFTYLFLLCCGFLNQIVCKTNATVTNLDTLDNPIERTA